MRWPQVGRMRAAAEKVKETAEAEQATVAKPLQPS